MGVKIGTLGAGHIGATIGRLWAKAAHDLRFGTRNHDALGSLVNTVLVGRLADGVGFEPGSPFFDSGIRAAELGRWLAQPRGR